MDGSAILHEPATKMMVPGEGGDYIAEMLELRAQLYTIQHPIPAISFHTYLVNGIPDEWEIFKEVMRSNLGNPTREVEDCII